jgi:S-adenosylmethionine:tRNA ribosyltransferase-isomerase
MELLTADFDYELPGELIAQSPAERREESRLLVLDRRSESITHDVFRSIPLYLQPGDLVIANRSKVTPARLRARKATGGAVELLLLRPESASLWRALARPSRKLRPGTTLHLDGSALQGHVETDVGDGQWLIRFHGMPDAASELRRVGTVPLPPYIRNGHTSSERYQTIYADREGSVAAPTAGLHFSAEVMDALSARRIDIQFVTLHIGLGTFRPVTAERLKEHRMHSEWGEVPRTVVEAIRRTREGDGKVVAIGTTSTRLLETACDGGEVVPFVGETDRFIVPGHRFGVVDALVTNFHLPRSTLLMLVSAFAGRESVLNAYREAIALKYRFYSFGDAMLIL